MTDYALAQDRGFQLGSAGSSSQSALLSLLDMLKRYAFGFYEVITSLEKLRNKANLYAYGSYSRKSEVDVFDRAAINKALLDMHKQCELLDIVATPDLILFMQSEIHRKGDDYNYNDLLKDVETLSFSFTNELRKRFFFRIPDNRQEYFQKDDLFGLEVSVAFPSSVREITSAGNCFALEEWDACVFHLMRSLEHPLRALANALGVPPPVKQPQTTLELRTWGDVINQIIIEINKRPNPKTPQEAELAEFYNRAAEQFQFFKDAWRDVVMHSRNKPYLEGETKDLIKSVEIFIRRLATRLKE
jgi:hypothetical protein